MNAEALSNLWLNYASSEIDMTIDPADHMFDSGSSGKPLERRMYEYRWCGDSAARVILGTLALSPRTDVTSVLDYACGGGRVARHLRALFPSAKHYFSDIAQERSEFCARQFNGNALPATADFSGSLGVGFDLIWVGSLFTHLSYPRMEALFDFLYSALIRNGLLIATFHGPALFGMNMKFISAEKWALIIGEFNRTGIGFQSYGRHEGDDVGVSVVSMENVRQLGTRHANSRIISYSEVAWAGLQDVCAWTKL